MGTVLAGCPPPCTTMHTDNGSLPEEALALVPYQNGSTYRFVHSAGKEILFQTSRETSRE
ncbi:MAG: hypothetical protein GY790_10840 [Bacteroidetes bacterium]|nr:hypothetical protein [Bacteroidota bacterium]